MGLELGDNIKRLKLSKKLVKIACPVWLNGW